MSDIVGQMKTEAFVSENFGAWLRREIAREGIPVLEFCRRSSLPRATVNGWLREGGPRPQRHQLAAVAKGLGRAIGEVEAAFQEDEREGAVVAIEVLNRPGQVVKLPRRVPIVGGIAASRFSEEGDDASGFVDFDGNSQFFLAVEGDCMEPDYQDGELVLFSTSEVESEGIVDGQDYGIRRAGEKAETTFKRAYADPRRREVYLLRCVNPKYKSQQLRVRRDDISRIGKAIWAMRQPRNRR